VSVLTYIGEGGNWKVYRMQHSDSSRFVIIRQPISFPEWKIQSYIKNYQIIKEKTSLVTLEEVIEVNICGRSSIQSEDLNHLKDRIYVSHNSLISNKQKEGREALKELFNNTLSYEKESPEAEKFRHENRIDEITNFKQFIDDVTMQLRYASNENVLIGFDSYFIGSERNLRKTSIDYKIADLDDIHDDHDFNQNELYEKNLSGFFVAIYGFITCFVEEDSQEEYLNILKRFVPF
jgi:hypothetical protein